MPRGEAERVTGLKERSARMVLADLVKDGIVNSQTPKGPISLRFTSQSIDAVSQVICRKLMLMGCSSEFGLASFN